MKSLCSQLMAPAATAMQAAAAAAAEEGRETPAALRHVDIDAPLPGLPLPLKDAAGEVGEMVQTQRS
jgi:hypothetical protein